MCGRYPTIRQLFCPRPIWLRRRQKVARLECDLMRTSSHFPDSPTRPVVFVRIFRRQMCESLVKGGGKMQRFFLKKSPVLRTARTFYSGRFVGENRQRKTTVWMPLWCFFRVHAAGWLWHFLSNACCRDCLRVVVLTA